MDSKSHNESLYTTTTPSPPATYTCDRSNVVCGCGYRSVEFPTSKIIGGETAIPNSWSMIVSIQGLTLNSNRRRIHVCGGTIINEWYILTAAHCVDNDALFKYFNLTISFGLHNRSEFNQSTRNIERIIVHPLWKSGKRFSNDIALIRLSQALEFETNPFISRTCRPERMNSGESRTNYPLNGTMLITIGWGALQVGKSPELLQQVNLYSIHHNDRACKNIVYDYNVQFCAGVYDGRKSVCYGDSGGPIFQWVGDRWEQVGITSYVPNGCARRDYPPVFTRLASYYDWIEENMNPSNYTTLTSTTITTTKIRQTLSTIPINNTNGRYTNRYRCNRTSSCGCGIFDVASLPYNNVTSINAEVYSWTMIVSIRLNDTFKHVCSGTILSNHYILTSAHCIQNQSLWKILVVPELYDLSITPKNTYQVDRIHQHPHFKNRGNYFENDIALLHLTKSIETGATKMSSRTCLPKINFLVNMSQYLPSHMRLAIIGWRIRQNDRSYLSKYLQQSEIVVIDGNASTCSQSNIDPKKQFCGKFINNQETSCLSDSGGPVFQWMNGYWDQVGMVSSNQCNVHNTVNIYTRLTYYFNWMTSILNYDNETLATETKINSTKPSMIYDCTKKKVNCGCGYNNVEMIQSRIIGGNNAVEASWTMFVSLRILNSSKHFCGGTLLSNFHVLTAAHCVQTFSLVDPLDLNMVAGITNRSDVRSYMRRIHRIYIHSNFTYTNNRFINDIAILELDHDLSIDSQQFLSRTCIPLDNSSSIVNHQNLTSGTPMIVIGWGSMLHDNYTEPDILQQVEVSAIDNHHPLCSSFINNITGQFCAGFHGRGGPCPGDFGGAIFQWTGDYWLQVGIISSSSTCENSSIPNIFTHLSYYRTWISDILNNTSDQLESTAAPILNTTASPPLPPTTINCSSKYTLNMILFEILIFLVFIAICSLKH